MRRAPKLDLVPLLGALADPSVDDTTDRILDAAAEVLASGGLRRCTVEEIAERGHIGRTTIYRRFDGRDEIVYGAAVIDAVIKSRPATAKGAFVEAITLSATMSPGVAVDPSPFLKN